MHQSYLSNKVIHNVQSFIPAQSNITFYPAISTNSQHYSWEGSSSLPRATFVPILVDGLKTDFLFTYQLSTSALLEDCHIVSYVSTSNLISSIPAGGVYIYASKIHPQVLDGSCVVPLLPLPSDIYRQYVAILAKFPVGSTGYVQCFMRIHDKEVSVHNPSK